MIETFPTTKLDAVQPKIEHLRTSPRIAQDPFRSYQQFGEVLGLSFLCSKTVNVHFRSFLVESNEKKPCV